MPPAILAGGVPSLNYSPPCDSCALPRFKESTEGEPRWPCIPRPPPPPCRIPGAAARRLLLELVFLACRTGGGDGGHGRAGRTAGAVIGERSWLRRLLGCGFKDPGRGSIWRSERSCRLRWVCLMRHCAFLMCGFFRGEDWWSRDCILLRFSWQSLEGFRFNGCRVLFAWFSSVAGAAEWFVLNRMFSVFF